MSADRDTARALWVIGARAAELREERLPPLGADDVLVEAEYSGVSRGTESLVFRGAVPEAVRDSMRCPHQVGDFPWPVKYGYCSVGRVSAGPAELVGKRVFCLYPHQDRYVVSAQAVVPVPEAVPAPRAVLAANMETAVNALWDAEAGVGGRVCVVGAGALGLLSASLLSRMPGVELQVVDVSEDKRRVCMALGVPFAAPASARDNCDIVIHTSSSSSGLETAIALAGFEGTIIELSWYGDRPVTVGLGGRFHHQRLTIRSSQVGHVAHTRRARWSYRRRMQLALELLADPRFDQLLEPAQPFEALPQVLERLLTPSSTVTQVIRYGAG
jgi:2-desacetyl-2-hydroxyethyl bacteriochlorophyllide A dehydrogenase